MKPFMSIFNSQGYALMRIVVGFLFLWHGVQKLFGFPSAMPAGVPTFIIYVAGPIELIGGTLVMIGLFTRWAAFLASGLMASAYCGWLTEQRRCCQSRTRENPRRFTALFFCSSPLRVVEFGVLMLSETDFSCSNAVLICTN